MNVFFKAIESIYGAERGKMVRETCLCVSSKIVDRNLFGWRSFIDDVMEELVQYMIKTGFKYSGGAYVVCGMQSAIDHSRYCSRQKRRGDYELISLDELISEDCESPKVKDVNEVTDLLFEIEVSFGKDVADELEPFLTGKVDKISKAIKKKLNTPEFRKFLEEVRK
jgi:hypothetical protein